MKKLRPLKPKVKLQSDFFVFDVETVVSYTEWCNQRVERLRKEEKEFTEPPIQKPGFYFGLAANKKAFKLGVIYGENYSKTFTNADEMIQEFQTERFKNKKVFAHNAFYDMTTLFGNIYKLDNNAIFNGSRFISAKNGNGKMQFCDSMNIYQTSVAKIGEAMGIPKPNLGDEYYTPDTKEGWANVENRCYQDCKIVWEALFAIFEMAGDQKITQASLAMTYFRRHHLDFYIEHNEVLGKYFRKSYYGGRTEAFKLGKTYASCWDINSSYPRAMVDCIFPNPKYLKETTKISVKNFNNYLDNYEGCALVTVIHINQDIGFLPLRMGGKLCFPVSKLQNKTKKFTGYWNFNELRYALEKKAIEIVKVSRMIYSERMESPFKKFILYLYDLRLRTTNEFEKFRIKIFMNSLYGKFIQQILTENIYIPNIEKCYDIIHKAMKNRSFIKLLMFNKNRKDAQLTVKSKRMENLEYAIPCLSSYITSYSRIALLEGLLPHVGKGLVYCDTDSKFIENDFGLISSSKLGEWKKEDKIIHEVRGLKNYVWGEEKTIINASGNKEKKYVITDKIKGVPKGALKTGSNTYEYFNLIKSKEALRRNINAGDLVKRIKVISGDYDKRIVLSNGETKPITI